MPCIDVDDTMVEGIRFRPIEVVEDLQPINQYRFGSGYGGRYD
jgi:hypothetical protein